MSTQIMCALFDIKLGQYNNPLTFPSKGVALRSFSDECQRDNPENGLRQHPEDYLFYQIGTYDPDTGLITPEQVPVMIANASDFV